MNENLKMATTLLLGGTLTAAMMGGTVVAARVLLEEFNNIYPALEGSKAVEVGFMLATSLAVAAQFFAAFLAWVDEDDFKGETGP